MDNPGGLEDFKGPLIFVGIILAIGIFAGLIAAIREKFKEMNAEAARKERQRKEDLAQAQRKAELAALKTRADQLASFLANRLGRKRGRNGLQTPNLNTIQGEFAKARAAHWDLVLPRLQIDLSSGCWQCRVTDQSRAPHPDMDVIITPTGQWAILGKKWADVIVRGNMHTIGDVPWVSQSTEKDAPIDLQTLRKGIEIILERHLPSALAEFQSLCKNQGPLPSTTEPSTPPRRQRRRNR